MKKFLITAFTLLISLSVMAQANADRTLQLYYGGKIIYSRALSLLDSLNFKVKTNLDDEGGDGETGEGGTIDGDDQIYIGVVGFHGNIFPYEITNNLEGAKNFINALNNDVDKTAFAYAVSKGNEMFDAPDLPEFDKIFMLNFSDGTDNGSSDKWLMDDISRDVEQNFVYDTARYDISQREKLNSYALGFGASEANFREKMQKVVLGKGYYKSVSSSTELQSVFNEVSRAIIASSKNVSILTQNGNYKTSPKILRLKFESGALKDSIDISVIGNKKIGYTLEIAQRYNNYISLDDSIQGIVRTDLDKLEIPLNNLKFIVNGEEQQFEFKVLVSSDGGVNFIEEVEEASKAESISKRIAVVLVLDCSTSMGDAFEPMKEAAIDFIETLENMDPNDDAGIVAPTTGTENGHEWVDLGLPSGTKWATTNVGATSPEGYGNYYAWGETSTKSTYNWSTYKWCRGSSSSMTKYCTSSSYGTVDNKTTLDLSDDAAYINWGSSWRMPTKAEQDELRNTSYTTWTWTTQNGVNGYKVTSKTNGNSIFLPAAGYRLDSSLGNAGSNGNYWSSSLGTSYSIYAYVLYFGSSNVGRGNDGRNYGQSVRAVLR